MSAHPQGVCTLNPDYYFTIFSISLLSIPVFKQQKKHRQRKKQDDNISANNGYTSDHNSINKPKYCSGCCYQKHGKRNILGRFRFPGFNHLGQKCGAGKCSGNNSNYFAVHKIKTSQLFSLNPGFLSVRLPEVGAEIQNVTRKFLLKLRQHFQAMGQCQKLQKE